jgi:hypothetical protein
VRYVYRAAQDDRRCLVAHLSDGVRVDSPLTFLARAGTSLHAAWHQLEDDPTLCSPRELPGLLAAAQRALALITCLLACLTAADLNPRRRDSLDEVVGQLRVALARLAECEPTPRRRRP